MTEAKNETIAILGGTGDLGTGLAIRWSKAGHRIIIGSRTLEKAQKAVEALAKISPDTPADAMENGDAAAAGDIVVLTVPAEHQISTLESVRSGLSGKILIDVTVPLVPPKVGTVDSSKNGCGSVTSAAGTVKVPPMAEMRRKPAVPVTYGDTLPDARKTRAPPLRPQYL